MAEVKRTQKRRNKDSLETRTVYSPCQITKRVILPITSVGKNLPQTLETVIDNMVSGKCIVEGFVKAGSVKIIGFSSGIIKGNQVMFDVVYNCMVCYPVAGMHLQCVAKNITKAGIRAESAVETPSPFVMYIARDHYYASQTFNNIAENDTFTAVVIEQRFELNEKFISVIGQILPPKKA